MAVFRKETQQYTVIPQAVIRDERLSLKDMGLLLRLLSFPDNWEFSENGLVAVFTHDGQAAVRSSLKRLEDFGYLVRKRCRDEHGKLTNCEWTIYDTPNCDFPNLDNPNLGKPNLEKPRLENRPQSNTKESNTKEFITKEYLNKDTLVVYVGIHYDEEGKMCGDVARDNYSYLETYSPVPRGVGPLTNIALMQNLLLAKEM